jgi:histidine triad (HIT) family protein
MPDCIFCKITQGEMPSLKVYEDENSFAFLDIKPNNLGHTLLIPKEHSRNIFDITEETLCALMGPLKKLAHATKEAASADGISITMNNEPAAYQIVFHAHFHIIPRFEGDNMKHKNIHDHEMEKIAEKIKAQLT